MDVVEGAAVTSQSRDARESVRALSLKIAGTEDLVGESQSRDARESVRAQQIGNHTKHSPGVSQSRDARESVRALSQADRRLYAYIAVSIP